MDRDERLLPLPNISDIQKVEGNQDFPSGYPSSYDEGYSENRSIQEYLHIVYKRLPVILAITIIVTAATAFYMYRKPSVYSASTGMIIEPPQPKVQNVNITLAPDYKYYNTQLKLLQNRELLYDVVVETGLYKDPNLLKEQGNKGVVATVRSMFSGDKPKNVEVDTLAVTSNEEGDDFDDSKIVLTGNDKANAEALASMLAGSVTVTQEEGTNIVDISVQSTNPNVASIVANGIAEVFMKQDIERETRKAKDVYADLTKSINELKSSLNEQEGQLIRIMSNYDFSLIDEKGSELISNRLGALSNSWLAAMDDRRKAEANYQTAAQTRNPGDLPSSTFNTKSVQDARNVFLEESSRLREQIRGIDQNISKEEARLKELLVRYREEYIEVRKTRALIDELKRSRDEIRNQGTQRISQETSKIESRSKSSLMNSMGATVAAARAREAKSRNAYLTEVAKANVQGKAARELNTIRQELDAKRSLYNTYIQKQKEQELLIASSLPDNITISSKAITPVTPIGPERNRNIILAFLVSLLGGVGLAFLMDYLDDSIRTSDDVERQLGLPTLALVPHQEVVSKKSLADGGKQITGGENVHSLALIAINDPRSPVAEAYRHLRTSLLFSSAGNPPRSVLITSSQPSEGKTTTAINTAITLAQSGASVVILDCDLRRPRLHSHFGMSNSHGITNYLSGDKNTENLLKPVPELPNMKVISSGPIPPNPAELLSSNEMKNLVHFLKTSYDHVVIDSPPAISFTDAAILSTLVDGVVIVAKAGSSSIHLLRKFKQRLAGLGTRIYGVVLNDVKRNSLEYGYYGYDFDDYSNTDESTPLLEDESDHEDFEPHDYDEFDGYDDPKPIDPDGGHDTNS